MYLVEEYGFHVAFETVQKSPPVRAGFLDSVGRAGLSGVG